MLQALLFDVDGTLADTEMTHLSAFNHAFAELGLDWHWDVPLYRRLLAVSGGKERIRAYWTSRHDLPRAMDGQALNQTIDRLHEIKTATYEAAVQEGQVQLRPGVIELLASARQSGLRLAIATTTSPVNIHAMLKKALGLDWAAYFPLRTLQKIYCNRSPLQELFYREGHPGADVSSQSRLGFHLGSVSRCLLPRQRTRRSSTMGCQFVYCPILS